MCGRVWRFPREKSIVFRSTGKELAFNSGKEERSPPTSEKAGSSSSFSPLPSPAIVSLDVSIRKRTLSKLLASSLLLKAILEIGEKKEDFLDNFYSLLCSVSLQTDGVIGSQSFS